MHMKLVIAGVVFTSVSGVLCDLCDLGSENIDGNTYCQPVRAIRYSNVGAAGTYNDIVEMSADGSCSSKPKHFSGVLSPLDEEVSLHFRGPVHLKQLAAYNLSTSSHMKRSTSLMRRRHQHHMLHKARKPLKAVDLNKKKREIISATINGVVESWENNYSGTVATDPVVITATMNGQVVSWTNNWHGPSTTSPAPPASTSPSPAALHALVAGSPAAAQPAKASPPPFAPVAPAASVPAPVGVPNQEQPMETSSPKPFSIVHAGSNVYERIGYYDAASQTMENLVFLGNYGGEEAGSGVFDYHFGSSLAYANCEGTGGAASPQILADAVLPSDKEIIVMLGEKCVDGGACGYSRPGTVAHQGFGGADKLFLMEFSMPNDGQSGFNGDMPAIWMLNAKIPRTLQYGKPDCSCWKTGCGEFDIAETLHSGSNYLKSTLHTNEPAGDSDYILRPTTKTLKLAVIFKSNDAEIHIEVLPDSTVFSSQMTSAEIDGLCNSISEKAVSRFHVLKA